MLAFYNTDRKTVKERSIYRSRVCMNSKEHENVMSFRRHIIGPPWVLGIWGEWLFIFRELGSTGNYFQGFGEQAHSFGDLGIPAKKNERTSDGGNGNHSVSLPIILIKIKVNQMLPSSYISSLLVSIL